MAGNKQSLKALARKKIGKKLISQPWLTKANYYMCIVQVYTQTHVLYACLLRHKARQLYTDLNCSVKYIVPSTKYSTGFCL